VKTLLILLATTFGNITLELDAAKAPQSVDNFVQYVNEGHYDGTVFHRVIDGFMVQGGGFTPDMVQKKTRAPVRNEADNGLSNRRGTVAMARTSDPHSATAQFFINTVDNRFLDHTSPTPQGWGYTVFGRVVGGMDVVDRIGKARTGERHVQGYPVPDIPLTPIVITKARVLTDAEAAAFRAASGTPATPAAKPAPGKAAATP
jgi:peptidyl-prolyl cis-trans isomerase B (cyclophilin B)